MSSRSRPLHLLVAIAVLAPVLAPGLVSAQRRTLSLSEALAAAEANVPALRQVRAEGEVAAAQADLARAPLLPQLGGSALYQRGTSNFIPRPSSVPNSINTASATTSGATYNYFNFGLTLSQTLFDAPSFERWRGALATLGAQQAMIDTARLDLAYNVRLAFFNARATHELLSVATETLANQRRHLDQVRGFVEVGTRPEIDLAQSRTDVANAQVALITAENNDEVARAQLNLQMGSEADTSYEIGEGVAAPVELEDALLDEQILAAARSRPELVAFEERLRAQALALGANRWGYAPTLTASTSLTDGGVAIDSLAWNWNFQAQLSWNLFGGLSTYTQVRQAQAQLRALSAQRDAQRQQVRVELSRARLALRAAKATLVASGEALLSARQRAQLAEGRYQAGVGNALEISDAVVALANASAQRVQADFNIASSRAQLLRALGRH